MNEYEVKVVVTMVVEADDECEATKKAIEDIGPVGDEIRVENVEKTWG